MTYSELHYNNLVQTAIAGCDRNSYYGEAVSNMSKSFRSGIMVLRILSDMIQITVLIAFLAITGIGTVLQLLKILTY